MFSLTAAYNSLMGGENAPKAKKYGAIAGTGIAITVAQLYAAQEFIFTRKEAEAQERRIDRVEEMMVRSIGAIQLDINAVRSEMSITNRNVGILMHELKVKSSEAEELRTRLSVKTTE